jgi:hypothetical protein
MGAVADYRPDQAIEFVKNLPDRIDRLITQRLWLDSPPGTMAAIADELKISRPAVLKRVRKLVALLRKRFPAILLSKPTRSETDGDPDEIGWSEFQDFEDYPGADE